jgi:hypothetical protein
MVELSKRDWVLIALFTFVGTGTALVILYWLYRMGW